MKKTYNLFLTAAVLMLSLTGCSDKDPFITAGPDDTPRFLSPSSIEGNATVSRSQTREDVFVFPNKSVDGVEEIVMTPAKYVTIEWISDGYVLGTGTSFSKQFEAGDYDLLIKATTQAGKVATRTVKLSVSALATDPQINKKEKNRWLNPGQPLTIEGTNLVGVKKLVFTPVIEVEEAVTRADEPADTQPVMSGDGSIELLCEASEDGSNVIVNLPADMVKGIYRISAVKDNEERFGCGLVTVTDEKWVDPDYEEVALWEGDQAIDWNADLCKISAEQMADVPVGTDLKVYYTTPEAEYHAMRIITPWWGDNPEDNIVAQFDITDETPNPFIFVYDERCKALVEERGGMCLVGFGYNVQKVAYDRKVGATVLWEDTPVTIDWNADLCKLTTEQMAAVPVGATIYIHYDMPEAEYHAMRITTPWWGDNPEDNLVAQFDLTAETPNPFEFTYDQHCKQLVEERGGMCLVGFGYRVSKIAFK